MVVSRRRRGKGARVAPRYRPGPPGRGAGPPGPTSVDHDLVGQRELAAGQVEDRLLRQLLGVIRPGPTLQDDDIVGANDMEVADPSAGLPLDVALQALGQVVPEPGPPGVPRILPALLHRCHASPPGDRRYGDPPSIVAAELSRIGSPPRRGSRGHGGPSRTARRRRRVGARGPRGLGSAVTPRGA